MATLDFITSFAPKPTNYRQFINLEDKVFGRLTVIGYLGSTRSRKAAWACRCECGNVVGVASKELRNGDTKSCGCLRRDVTTQFNLKRGEKYSRGVMSEYKAFRAAKSRCENPNDAQYPRYGGRGIEFRLNSFEEMLEDIGLKPSKEHTLDRRNNNGHYEVGNLRWVTQEVQARNTSTNVRLSFKGKTKCVSEWARELGINRRTMYARVHNGYCEECVFTKERRFYTCRHNSPILVEHN